MLKEPKSQNWNKFIPGFTNCGTLRLHCIYLLQIVKTEELNPQKYDMFIVFRDEK